MVMRAQGSSGVFSAMLVAVMGLSLTLTGSAGAATAKKKAPVVRSATLPNKDAELVIDARTGKVFFSRNASVERYPASLTKMMTMYLLFEAMKKGQVSLNTPMTVSAHAAAQKPTKLGMAVGDTIPVEIAIKSIVVRSANDVAVVIAEYLGGTETNFATLMTQKARALGMRRTNFHNASGLPDRLQVSTAEDMALLARHLAYDFPEYFPYFATAEFSYRGYTYQTHNNLIGRFRGTDGIKTGYTQASGFNLVTSVVRGDNHIIGVVMGGRTAASRDNEMKKILDNVYAKLEAGPAMAQADIPAVTAVVPAAKAAPARPSNMLASLSMKPATPDNDDEDTAEARREDGLSPKVFAAKTARLTIKPTAKPNLPNMQVASAKQQPMIIAAYQQPAKPAAKPANTDFGEGDIGGTRAPISGAQGWSIQIGAFTDPALARNQLANYAEKSMDVLGQAARLVVPFQAVDGNTLYRARFGPFAEREARQVCSRLTQRGQTCFATVR